MRLTLQFKFTDAQLLQFHYDDGVGIPIPQVGDRVMRRAIDSGNSPKVITRTFQFSELETAIYFQCE